MRHLFTLLCTLLLLGSTSTVSMAQCGSFNLILSDSQSNGWESFGMSMASVDVFYDWVFDQSYTLIDSHRVEYDLPIDLGDTLTIRYVPAQGNGLAQLSNFQNCLMVEDQFGVVIYSKLGAIDTFSMDIPAYCTEPESCIYYAELFDSGAESWGAAALFVKVGNDTLEFAISNEDSHYELFPFYVPSGSSFSIDYREAIFTNWQIQYRILDENLVTQYNSGVDPSAGADIYTGIGSCMDTCSIVCPSDTIINLGSGECDIIYDYVVSVDGLCAWPVEAYQGFSGPFSPGAAIVVDTSGGAVLFDNAPDSILLISSNSGGPDSFLRTSVTWEVPKDGMLEFDWSYFTFDFGGPSFDFLLSVQTGGMDTILVDTTGGFVQSGSFMTSLNTGDSITIAMVSYDGIFGPGFSRITNFVFESDSVPYTLQQIAGLPSGAAFPIDTNVVTWEVSDFSGNVTQCTFNVIVNENPNQSDDLFCIQGLQVSLGSNCSATIDPTIVLSGDSSYGCFDNYWVYFQEPGMGGAYIGGTIDGSYIGQVVEVHVVDTSVVNGNSCWSTALIEDKIRPTISCNDVTVACNEVDSLPLPIAMDNCDGDPEIILLDSLFVPMPCNAQYSGQIMIEYTAEDDSGNRSDTCVQTILIERIDINDVDFPDSLLAVDDNALSCDSVWYIVMAGDTVPDPDQSGYPVLGDVVLNEEGAMQLCGLVVTFDDVEIPTGGTCVRKFMRTWTVQDVNCPASVQMITGLQVIEVTDTVAPTIVCPPDFTYDGVMVDCEADILLPAAIVSDNWSGVAQVDMILPVPPYFIADANGGEVVTLPAGVHTITYRVYDNCGLPAECSYEITVVDGVQPVPVCKPGLVVSLTEDGTATVDAETFDSGSTDECGVDSFAVARMFPGCNGDDDLFGPEIVFGCCDMAENPIMVILRVLDEAGNFNECMVEVEVQDKINPTFQCPPPVTISCEYPIDTNNLSVFGTLMILDDPNSILNPATDPRGDVIVDDPGNPDSPTNFGKDGWVYDNCAVSFTETWQINKDQCNVGEMLRTFTIRNGAGMIVGQCTQVITITNFTPFNPETDVIWPADTVVYNICSPDDLDPADFGMPIVTEDACDRVGIGYDDCIFNILDEDETACFKVLRKWKITDECQKDQAGNHIVWTKDQVIMFMNNIAPVISGCNDQSVCSYDPDCGVAFLPLAPSATDDCTPVNELVWSYAIDLYNDNTIDYTPGNNPYADNENTANDASGAYPVGEHRIVWTVEDKCGNQSTCSNIFEVQNCKLPLAYCHHLSVNLNLMDMDRDGVPETPMVVVWAEDVDAGSNHPCYDDVTVSFDPSGNQQSIAFGCDVKDSTVVVPVYVTDPNGNQDYCLAQITVQDNQNICPETDPLTGSISGAVYTESGELLFNAEVMLMGSNANPDMTDEDGAYGFFDMQLGGSYTVEPHKNDDVLNGVTTYDIALIQRHILGLSVLTNPYKLIAADVDDSEVINVLDIVELRKVILGVQDEFNHNESWKFIDANHVFTSDNPLSEAYNTSYVINSFNSDMLDINFVAVKIGDLSGDAEVANADGAEIRSFDDPFRFHIMDQNVTKGETVNVAVHVSDKRPVLGFQFTYTFDATSLELAGWSGSEVIGYNNINSALAERGMLMASWNQSDYSVLNADKALFTMTFRALADGQLSDMMDINGLQVRDEVYVPGEVLPLDIEFGEAATPAFALHQNVPNPYNATTTIAFELPEASIYKLDIMDVEGGVVRTIEQSGNAGMNKINFSATEAGMAAGIYYYRLQAGENTAVKKMVLLD